MKQKDKGEGGLYAGGFSRGGKINGYYVIDLTGDHYKNASDNQIEVYDEESLSAFEGVLQEKGANSKPLGWLNFPIKDFGVPDYDTEIWLALAKDVKKLINNGEKVLVVCMGGHGRTGMAGAILSWMLAPDGIGDNPVEWIRKVHCEEAVETDAQVDYVFKVLAKVGLPDTKRAKTTGSKVYTPAQSYMANTYNTKTQVLKDGKLVDAEWDTEKQKYVPVPLEGNGGKKKEEKKNEIVRGMGADFDAWSDFEMEDAK